jgi:hypothetical protein
MCGGTKLEVHRWSTSDTRTEIEMTSVNKVLLGAAMGVGMLALSAISASAAIVCSGNVCWHTPGAYEYPPEAGVVVHPNDWRWGANEHYTWREHEGRGYWRGDRWMER